LVPPKASAHRQQFLPEMQTRINPTTKDWRGEFL